MGQSGPWDRRDESCHCSFKIFYSRIPDSFSDDSTLSGTYLYLDEVFARGHGRCDFPVIQRNRLKKRESRVFDVIYRS